jgi:ADP-ribosyl-[dinitrogen reductase] hydrolase
MITTDRVRGCMLGLAIGDAIGTTVEFKRRGTFARVTDMVGGGPFALEPGQWTDDTAMALCLGTSLLEREGSDPGDQMERYVRWFREGYMSCTGTCFDIGSTVRQALLGYESSGNPFSGSTDPRSAGNGCIMRLAPVAIFYWGAESHAEQAAAASCRTTHGAAECVDACRLLARMLVRATRGAGKHDVLFADREYFDVSSNVGRIAAGGYAGKPADEISGSGYVVSCLEAALWCFHTTDTFADAVLAAANLGDDADTTAAVCGQVAGAYYGESAIPAHWRARLAWADRIGDLARDLHWFTRSLIRTEPGDPSGS